jgi:transposase-like protein
MAGSGYRYARLSRNQRAYVHHLVLAALLRPRPAGYQAAHGDGNKLNNTAANLRWATPKENNADKLRHGTALLGTKNPMGRKTHCKRGHPFDEDNTHLTGGYRYCRTCGRDHQRRYCGTPTSRFRNPLKPRLSEGLRLMAEGVPASHAAQLAKIGRNTLRRAWRSGLRAL